MLLLNTEDKKGLCALRFWMKRIARIKSFLKRKCWNVPLWIMRTYTNSQSDAISVKLSHIIHKRSISDARNGKKQGTNAFGCCCFLRTLSNLQTRSALCRRVFRFPKTGIKTNMSYECVWMIHEQQSWNTEKNSSVQYDSLSAFLQFPSVITVGFFVVFFSRSVLCIHKYMYCMLLTVIEDVIEDSLWLADQKPQQSSRI